MRKTSSEYSTTSSVMSRFMCHGVLALREGAAAGYSARFDDDGLNLGVYKLNDACEHNLEGLEGVIRTTSLDLVPLAFHLYWTSLMVIEPLVGT